jgi:hypothetical protein
MTSPVPPTVALRVRANLSLDVKCEAGRFTFLHFIRNAADFSVLHL